jgi:predicted amidohydrolase YtcJ
LQTLLARVMGKEIRMRKLFVNGIIHTMNGEEVVGGLLVEGGKVIALDPQADAAGDCEVIDLGGRTVIPGFHDSHQHFLCYATDKEKINFFGAKSLQDMADLTADYIKKYDIKKGQWIQGGGWNENNFADGKLPSREDLDAFCPENPAIFTRACCSTAVANTLALKEAGIFHKPPILTDGVIVVDEAGVPTGILEERARFIVYDILPKYHKDELKEFIFRYQEDLLEAGLTSVQTDDFKLWDAQIEDILAAYRELDAEGRLKVRFVQQLRLITHEELDEYLASGDLPYQGTSHFKTGAFKLLLDGSLGGKTAALWEDYQGFPGHRGIMTYGVEEFYSLLEKAHKNNLQLAMHGIGDRTIDTILDCYEKLAEEYPKDDPRFRIIHCQITSREALERFRKNEVIADVQPLFIRADMEIAQALLGKERLQSSYNWKTMLDMGIHVSGSSDAPVESFAPLTAIYCAVTSQNLAGQPQGGWMPEQRLSRQEAVELYTTGAAFTSFEEKVKGKLIPGYLADFLVLDRDIFKVPAEELLEARVLQTYIDGELVYQA